MQKELKISPTVPYQSHYADVLDSQMHYLDEGEGDPILFLHGNPTSSYLWRNVIPHLTKNGRCIAPDLIGMGKSGKPDIEYRFRDHYQYLEAFIEALGLTNITLVIHDWGSALGFHYASQNESNVKAIAFMEALLMPTPSWDMMPLDAVELFQAFRTPDVGWEMIGKQNMFVEQVLPSGIMRTLSEEEMDQYRAPYQEIADRKPIWRWPNEIPIAGSPPENVALVGAYNQWLQQTDLPKLLLYATPGTILVAPLVEWCKQNLRNLHIVHVGEGLHFIQEDYPDKIGSEISDWAAKL